MTDNKQPDKVALLTTIKEEAVRAFARRLRYLAEGDLNKPETWIAVAESIGCRVPGCNPSCTGNDRLNLRDGAEEGTLLDDKMTPEIVCRFLVYGIALHLYGVYTPPIADDAKTRFLEFPEDFDHEVARATEGCLFPLVPQV